MPAANYSLEVQTIYIEWGGGVIFLRQKADMDAKRGNLSSWLPCMAIATHLLACHTGDNSQQVEQLK